MPSQHEGFSVTKVVKKNGTLSVIFKEESTYYAMSRAKDRTLGITQIGEIQIPPDVFKGATTYTLKKLNVHTPVNNRADLQEAFLTIEKQVRLSDAVHVVLRGKSKAG